MVRCPTCSYENLETSTYCERCGSVLNPTSAPTVPAYGAPSEPPPPESLLATQYAAVTVAKPRQHKRTVGEAILCSVLFLWAGFWASFGLWGILQYGVGASGISFLVFSICFLGVLALLVFLLRTRVHLTLGVWTRISLEVGLFVLGILGLALAVGIFPSPTYRAEQYAAFGGVFLVYGLIAAIFSLW